MKGNVMKSILLSLLLVLPVTLLGSASVSLQVQIMRLNCHV